MPEAKQQPQELVCIALGEDIRDDEIEIPNEPVFSKDITDPMEYCKHLEERVHYLTNAIDSLFAVIKELAAKDNRGLNEIIDQKKSDEVIPEGTILTGTTRGVNYFCQVKKDGFYVGVTKYPSLSAAAEGVSGVRRSGWTFWKLPNDKTVKEVYR